MENKNLARFLLHFLPRMDRKSHHQPLFPEGRGLDIPHRLLHPAYNRDLRNLPDRGFHLQPDLRRLQAQEHRLQEGRGSGRFSREPLRRTASHCARQSSFVCRFPPAVHPAAGKTQKLSAAAGFCSTQHRTAHTVLQSTAQEVEYAQRRAETDDRDPDA